MMLIFGLMLLLQTAACLDRFCKFNQVFSISPCYAALGDKLNLQMVLDVRHQDLYLYKMLNDGSRLEIFRIKNNKEHKHESIRSRSEFFFDKMTLIINNVIKADSGTYRSRVIEMDMGMGSDLYVTVEAPIGSVEVSTSCSSNQTSVSCSSEGDRITYSWILNGKILKQGFMNGKTTIQLDERTDGSISCSVKNHISHTQKTIRVKPCPEATTAPVTSSLTSAPVTSSLTSAPVTSSLTSTVTSSTHSSECVSVVFVLVWCCQLMVLLGLLGGFHIYMRLTSGKKQKDQKVKMRRFRERHEHTAEDL